MRGKIKRILTATYCEMWDLPSCEIEWAVEKVLNKMWLGEVKGIDETLQIQWFLQDCRLEMLENIKELLEEHINDDYILI